MRMFVEYQVQKVYNFSSLKELESKIQKDTKKLEGNKMIATIKDQEVTHWDHCGMKNISRQQKCPVCTEKYDD